MTQDLPARVQMPLLTLITQQALEEDYLTNAERRAAGAPLPPRRRSRRTASVVVAIFGLMASTAFVQTSRNSDVDDASRAVLIRRIDGQRGRLAQQQQRIATLRERNAGLERRVNKIADDEAAALVRNRRLQVRTGFIAVVGPGVRITVTEKPNADPNQVVHDTDLRLLVNGLWEAGAEAVAVNNQRITALSAIRFSGLAVRVNGVGIAAPYQVEAIGDTRTLSGRLFDTTTGLTFVGTARFYDFTYGVDNVDELRLPAAPLGGLNLRSASTNLGGRTGRDNIAKEVGP